MPSDTEADVCDYRRPQQREVGFSLTGSTPEAQRATKTILRVEYGEIVKEARTATGQGNIWPLRILAGRPNML